MPLFNVTWTRSCEWTVEGESREAVEEAAKAMRESDLDFDFEMDVSVYCLKPRKARPGEMPPKVEIHAVQVGDELLAPEDAEELKWKEKVQVLIDRGARIDCPSCEKTSSVEEWKFMGGDVALRCTFCHRDLTDDELDALTRPAEPDTATGDLFADGGTP
jgi:hypothetical protein